MFGRTPLHLAAAVGYAEMVEFLVSNGGLFVYLIYIENDTFTERMET